MLVNKRAGRLVCSYFLLCAHTGDSSPSSALDQTFGVLSTQKLSENKMKLTQWKPRSDLNMDVFHTPYSSVCVLRLLFCKQHSTEVFNIGKLQSFLFC